MDDQTPTQQSSTPTARNFAIDDVLSVAWKKTSGNRLLFWGAIMIYVAISIGFAVIEGIVFDEGNQSGAMAIFNLLFSLFNSAVGAILSAGLVLMGIRVARRQDISVDMVFSQLERALPVIFVSVLMSIAIFIGFLLLILPGIYLSIAYSLAIPLVVDKEMGAWEAMETSRKMVTPSWFSFFIIFLLWAIILGVSAIPLGIGLIWTIPTSSVLLGELYIRSFD